MIEVRAGPNVQGLSNETYISINGGINNMKKIIEWNVNGRSTSRRQAEASKFIFKKLMAHKPDAIVLSEYVSFAYRDLEILLESQNYSCFHSDNKGENENGILLAYRNDKYDKFDVPYPSAFELEEDKPNYFNLNLQDLETSQRIVLGGVRIKIGGCGSDLSEDFKNRRRQLNWLTNELKQVNYSMLTVGDLNCGFYGSPDEEQTFIGKPREFYNYYLIKNQMKKVGVTVTTPEDGMSWRYCRLDHCLSKNLNVLSSFYDSSFMKNPDYKHIVGYPDHSQLVVTYDF